ncbi:MAG: ribosomal protein S18-alanine N-acetyltransferase [Dehalococcoidia bacterium]
MAAVASPYIIRPMTIADIPQVSEIERESFPTMWPQTAYKRELQQNSMARYLVVGDRAAPPLPTLDAQAETRRLSRVAENVRRLLGKTTSLVAEEPEAQEHLVGFVGLWFMLEECHIVTVAVREERRRRGIGELLVIASTELALKKDQDVLTLECRVSNTGAQALYEKYGFRNVGVRKRYYTDNNEDALIMTTPPIRTPEYQALFEQVRAEHRERWGDALVAHPELQAS